MSTIVLRTDQNITFWNSHEFVKGRIDMFVAHVTVSSPDGANLQHNTYVSDRPITIVEVSGSPYYNIRQEGDVHAPSLSPTPVAGSSLASAYTFIAPISAALSLRPGVHISGSSRVHSYNYFFNFNQGTWTKKWMDQVIG